MYFSVEMIVNLRIRSRNHTPYPPPPTCWPVETMPPAPSCEWKASRTEDVMQQEQVRCVGLLLFRKSSMID